MMLSSSRPAQPSLLSSLFSALTLRLALGFFLGVLVGVCSSSAATPFSPSTSISAPVAALPLAGPRFFGAALVLDAVPGVEGLSSAREFGQCSYQ